MTRQIASRVALVLSLFAAERATAQRAATLPELDRFARAVTAGAPPLAMSIVVVRGDSVVHLAGYGLRDRARSLPVTAQSPFYIASATKSFTALTAALLAARGIVDLDAPVTRYAPEFRLPSPLDASRITLRRLLSHRGGFESGPLSVRTAFTGNITPDSLMPLLARSAVAIDTGFAYTNTAFIIAARVLERVTNTPWQDLVAREVVRPLGLTRTTARASASRGWELVEGFAPGPPPEGYRVFDAKPDEIMHAAGGMVMSAEDAGRWLRAQLGSGRIDARQLFPAQVIATTHRQAATQDGTFDSIRRFGYALGWQMGILDGDTLYHHFGNYPGSFAHISFAPSRGVGVAVFINTEMPAYGPVAGTVARRAYDLVLGRHDRDAMYAVYADTLAARTTRMFDAMRADHRNRATRPTTPRRGWNGYAGRYANSDLGEITIELLPAGGAELRFGVARSKLEVLNGDTLRVEMPPGRSGAPMPVEFGADGQVSSVRISGTTFARVNR